MLDKTSKGRQKSGTTDLSKRDKFIHLAESRTKTAISAIRTIAKLGNRTAYDYEEADVKKITGALQREIEHLKSRMLSVGGKAEVDFKL